MAIFTLAEVNAQIDAYKGAMLALATAREYTLNGKVVRREDLSEIRKHLEWLSEEKAKLESTSGHIAINVGVVRRY